MDSLFRRYIIHPFLGFNHGYPLLRGRVAFGTKDPTSPIFVSAQIVCESKVLCGNERQIDNRGDNIALQEHNNAVMMQRAKKDALALGLKPSALRDGLEPNTRLEAAKLPDPIPRPRRYSSIDFRLPHGSTNSRISRPGRL